MKVTFELPPPVVQQLRSHVPAGERSKFVSDLISEKLQKERSALERAARKANSLKKVNRDMKDWEALNGYDD
jgi:Arc/MetJ-type ribon-helix-helix transcriptional regulator